MGATCCQPLQGKPSTHQGFESEQRYDVEIKSAQRKELLTSSLLDMPDQSSVRVHNYVVRDSPEAYAQMQRLAPKFRPSNQAIQEEKSEISVKQSFPEESDIKVDFNDAKRVSSSIRNNPLQVREVRSSSNTQQNGNQVKITFVPVSNNLNDDKQKVGVTSTMKENPEQKYQSRLQPRSVAPSTQKSYKSTLKG